MGKQVTVYNKQRELITMTVSKGKAIKLRCLDCANHFKPGIRNCNHEDTCPLWPYRLGKKGELTGRDRTQAVKDYCVWCMADQKHEIKNCPVTHCALYPFRIGANKNKGGEENE